MKPKNICGDHSGFLIQEGTSWTQLSLCLATLYWLTEGFTCSALGRAASQNYLSLPPLYYNSWIPFFYSECTTMYIVQARVDSVLASRSVWFYLCTSWGEKEREVKIFMFTSTCPSTYVTIRHISCILWWVTRVTCVDFKSMRATVKICKKTLTEHWLKLSND